MRGLCGLKEKFDEFLDSITEKFEEVKEEVSDFAEKTQAKAEEVKKDVQTAKN